MAWAGGLRRAALASPLVAALELIGQLIRVFSQSLRYIVTGRMRWSHAVNQMSVIAVDSLPVVLTVIILNGMVVAFYTVYTLRDYGAQGIVGAIIGKAVTMELASLMMGLAVTARAGSAMAAEIGTMKVTEQIDAMRAMATDPIKYLVAPRLLACAVMFPALTVLAALAGIMGGYAVAVHWGVPASSYWDSMQHAIRRADIYQGLTKSLCFGVLMAVICCQQGLATTGGAEQVGARTTNAVVLTYAAIFIADFFVTVAYTLA